MDNCGGLGPRRIAAEGVVTAGRLADIAVLIYFMVWATLTGTSIAVIRRAAPDAFHGREAFLALLAYHPPGG